MGFWKISTLGWVCMDIVICPDEGTGPLLLCGIPWCQYSPHRWILDHYSKSVLKMLVHPSLCALLLSAFFSRVDARKRNVSILGHGHLLV